jgi:DNA-binding response OmpR family regulator
LYFHLHDKLAVDTSILLADSASAMEGLAMKLSILVADNDSDVREFYKRELESRNYLVHTAQSPEEARSIVETTHLHLILIDRRLTDDDPLDRSGEALAQQVAGPIPILIFTSYDLEDAFEATANVVPGKIEYVNKKKGFVAVLAKIEQVVADHVRMNRQLEIHGYNFAQMISDLEPDLKAEFFALCKGDMEDLFRSLFRLRRTLTVSRLPINGQSYIILHVLAQSHNGGTASFLVVCGKLQEIERAKANYEQYNLRHANALLLKDASRRRYAALAFDANGGTSQQMITLGSLGKLLHGDFVAVWANFVETTLRPWYQQYGTPLKGIAVIDVHCQQLKIDPAQLEHSVFERQASRICSFPLPGDYKIAYNSYSQLLTIRINGSAMTEIPANVDLHAIAPRLETLLGIANENLDLESILVDQHTHQSWLLDFRAIAPLAPLLLAFAKMELAVKSDMLDQARADLYERFQIEKQLASVSSLETPLDDEMLTSALRQSLATIQSIRHRAAHLTHIEDIRLYNSSLLLASLAALAGYSSPNAFVPNQQIRYTQLLIGVALIYQGLLPTEPMHQGLWIDRKNKRLRLNDREILLALGEYELVEYLARTPNQLCSFWSIISALYPSNQTRAIDDLHAQDMSPDQIEANKQALIRSYKPTLDSKVHRIRAAIPDTRPHRYLLNDRREGLRLNLAGELN